MKLADALNLDEIEAFRLLLDAQEEVDALDRSSSMIAIIRFHESRQFLLESLRLVLSLAANVDTSEEVRDVLSQVVALILETKDGPIQPGSPYVQRCLTTMEDVETWIHSLTDRMQRRLTLGEIWSAEFEEIIDFQQHSLDQQHESLSSIVIHLTKAKHAKVESFVRLLDSMHGLDAWNSIAVRYVPVLLAFISEYGSPEGSGSLDQARSLNAKITDTKGSLAWNLKSLQFASICWWLAEYSGWFLDQSTDSLPDGADPEAEANARSETFFEALRGGALQCTLSICSGIRPIIWYDPARSGLTSYLLKDTPLLPPEAGSMPVHFQNLIMEQFEDFVETFITNMPDTLRRFKFEEDDQRRKVHSRIQATLQNGLHEQDLHLERFLMIMAHAYERRPEAALSFWGDTDGNLYGFLQWASKRQSTPRVGAFCELFRAISDGELCAVHAHHFLLEEGATTPARLRRTVSLSWAQIFAELDLYASKIREHPVHASPATLRDGKPKPVEIDEPESGMMLECYLRLASHLCEQSKEVRSWILTHPSFRMMDVLFLLCSSAIPRRIRACAYTTIRSLLIEKTAELSTQVWNALDQWISSGFSSVLNAPKPAKSSALAEDTLESIATNFEESNAFIAMLQAFVAPDAGTQDLNDALAFPETLGSAYRMPGVEPYVDFIFGNVFAQRLPQLEDHGELRILSWNTLNFAATCLNTFNEDLIVLANRSNLSVDAAMNTSSLAAYVRLHPFCRVMEWMFNERVLAVLFSIAHQDVSEVSSASPDSSLLATLLCSIDVMNLIVDLQSTYLDIVQPLIKSQTTRRRRNILSPSLASFEDSVATHLDLIVDLGLYCGSGHPDLIVSSLKLLEKLSSSKKLNMQPPPRKGLGFSENRLIGVLVQNNDLERIARSMSSAMELDHRELSQGPEAAGYKIKTAILNFLSHSLAALPDQPNLCHALLGFSCNGNSIEIEHDSLFTKGISFFHTIVRLVVDYPDGEEGIMLSWCLNIKKQGLRVLQTLWESPLTSIYTLSELRLADFLFAIFSKQVSINPGTMWDARSTTDPEFTLGGSASALEHYLCQRRSLLTYSCAELRLAERQGVPSLKARIMSTLLGTTLMPNGGHLSNLTVFDFLDFTEIDYAVIDTPTELQYFADVDFSVSINKTPKPYDPFYDLKMIEELLVLRRNEWQKSSLPEGSTENNVLAEAQSLRCYFYSKNMERSIEELRTNTLQACANLIALLVNSSNSDRTNQGALITQAIQMLAPKLERYAGENRPEAFVFAKLGQVLLSEFDFMSSSLDMGRTSDVANDRLSQLFRVAIRAIHLTDEDVVLREALYSICYRYLANIPTTPNAQLHRRNSLQAIKAGGGRSLDIMCDDAYSGEGTCRIAALLVLDALAALANTEKTKYLIEAFSRTNFVVVLVETLSNIRQEVQTTNAKGAC